jgi:hypothetical protein
MQKSETIGALAKALSAFQGQVTDIPKTSRAHGNIMYAQLDEMLTLARPLLSAHGLSVVQFCGTADERVSVETVLMHESGEWMSGTIEMALDGGGRMNKAQSVGSVITYARRYSLGAVLGFTSKDDDGNAVNDRGEIIPPRPAINAIPDDRLRTVRQIEELWKEQYDEASRDGIMKQWLGTFKVERLADAPKAALDKLVLGLLEKKEGWANV